MKQHPGDAQLSLDELRDMVGRQGEAFSNRVLHYASSLRGTKQYWYQQRSRLLSMVDTLGLHTIYFTHSAADLQWPELARLICPEDPNSRSSRAKAVIDNPAKSDWFLSSTNTSQPCISDQCLPVCKIIHYYTLHYQ